LGGTKAHFRGQKKKRFGEALLEKKNPEKG